MPNEYILPDYPDIFQALAMIEQTPSRRATITGLEREHSLRTWRRNLRELEKSQLHKHSSLHYHIRKYGFTNTVNTVLVQFSPGIQSPTGKASGWKDVFVEAVESTV